MSEPDCPQKHPHVVEADAGNYVWCACGKSAAQPFCDGSHAGTGFVPVVATVDEKKTVAWCGCKRTGTPPFCDGSHANL